LDKFIKLEYLHASDTKISDLSSLHDLVNLTTIELAHNQISDISLLNKLTNLTNIQLSGNQISDISPLKNLTKIAYLYLDNNFIRDVSVFNGDSFNNLSILKLDSNDIIDLSQLKDAAFSKNLSISMLNQRNEYRNDLLDTGVLYDKPIILENSIKDVEGNFLKPTTFSNYARYDAPHIKWNIPKNQKVVDVWYKWNKVVEISNVKFMFSGTYTVKVLPRYTVTFMVDDKVYATKDGGAGSLIDTVQEPEKPDYTFLGWYEKRAVDGNENDKAWDFATQKMPAYDLTLYARYSRHSTLIDPSNPMEPSTPIDPSNPMEPSTPIEPSKPTNSTEEQDKATNQTDEATAKIGKTILVSAGAHVVELLVAGFTLLVLSVFILIRMRKAK